MSLQWIVTAHFYSFLSQHMVAFTGSFSGRTVAISGSRPSANHTAKFYRESAALRGSPCPGTSTGLMLQKPLLDAIRMIEIVQREVAEHDENGIPVVLGMRR